MRGHGTPGRGPGVHLPMAPPASVATPPPRDFHPRPSSSGKRRPLRCAPREVKEKGRGRSVPRSVTVMDLGRSRSSRTPHGSSCGKGIHLPRGSNNLLSEVGTGRSIRPARAYTGNRVLSPRVSPNGHPYPLAGKGVTPVHRGKPSRLSRTRSPPSARGHNFRSLNEEQR